MPIGDKYRGVIDASALVGYSQGITETGSGRLAQEVTGSSERELQRAVARELGKGGFDANDPLIKSLLQAASDAGKSLGERVGRSLKDKRITVQEVNRGPNGDWLDNNDGVKEARKVLKRSQKLAQERARAEKSKGSKNRGFFRW